MKHVRGQSWHFDDIPVGYVHQFGAAKVDAADLELFKDRFAPYLPLTADGAKTSTPPAAQAHVFALWSRMLWEETHDWPILARLGQDALRWYKTAHAGDVLSMRLTFMSKQPIDDTRGIMIAQHDVLNQGGELVMTLMSRTVIARV
jgi:acyl dehydratase